MKYTFSEAPVAEFYGVQFFAILRENGEVVAYSEKIFEVPEEVSFPGAAKPIIFGEAKIRGGEIWGGEIRGGEIWGGVIRGGVIRGGVIRGGVIDVSPLQIQGSQHFCYASPSEDGRSWLLGIGCKVMPISEWQKRFREIGESEGYSEVEILEYAEYIALFARLYPVAA